MAKRRFPSNQKHRQTFPILGAALVFALALAALLTQPSATGSAHAGLRLSEIMTDNASFSASETGEVCDWIEIENTSDQAISLKGYALMNAAKPADAFVFSGSTLQPGECIVVCADGAGSSQCGALCAPFKLASAGATVSLLAPNGDVIDITDVPALKTDEVWMRGGDGAWQISSQPTPGTTTAAQASPSEVRSAQSGAIQITEIMSCSVTFFADENGVCSDYIEIYNASEEAISLGGWSLTNDPERLRRWTFPDISLEPGGYLAVHCSGESRTDDPSHLHASFRLASDGGEICLTDASGAIAARVQFPTLNADQAWSAEEGGWTELLAPSPGYANTSEGADAAAALGGNSFGVTITEIAASVSDSSDWIELYNASSADVDLSGFGLSNNAGRPRKWQFPSGTVIRAGQYLVVSAGGDGEQLCTDFSLSAEGGYSVTLCDASGKIFDRMFVPKQYRNVSYGRTDAGLRYFEQPSPNAANAGAAWLGRAPQPEYSVPGGLYASGDTLTIALNAPSDCRIYYTLDCTDPDETSALYTGPITISAQTVLRARAYRDGCMPSYPTAQSYLFDAKNGSGSVYTVSVVSDPYNLISDEAGIMVAGSGSKPNYSMDWEREAHVEIYDQSGQRLLSQSCAIRQQGQTCRDQPQQCFKLIARAEYGDSRFHGELFSQRDWTEYRTLLLRNSSDDASKTRMRDSVLTTLAEDTSVLYQESEVCVVYINGVYWGHYNLREGIHPALICQHEGWQGDEDAIDLVAKNATVMQGSDDTFLELVAALKQYGSNTDAAYQAIDNAIDIQNYIEYMAIEIFTGNTDPSNVKRYRNADADGKWRWILYDIDWAFNQDTNSVARWLSPGGVGNGNRTDNTFFILCMANDTFRDRFLTYLGQQLATNFSAESVISRFKTRYELLQTILPDHFERWNESEAAYNTEVERLISYANARPTRMLQFLKASKALNLSRAQMEQYFGEVMAIAGLTYDQISKP